MALVRRPSVLAVGWIAATAVLWCTHAEPGEPVSEAFAATLRGGECSGATSAKCSDVDVCSNNGYTSNDAPANGNTPTGAATTYCTKTEDGETVCNDSSQSFDTCGE